MSDKQYFVDEYTCTRCGLCSELASFNFDMDDDSVSAFVKKQPESEDEEHDCMEAYKSCPVEAIDYE